MPFPRSRTCGGVWAPSGTLLPSAADVGVTAFQALFGLIDGDRLEGAVYQVPTKLIVRHSTLPAGRRG